MLNVPSGITNVELTGLVFVSMRSILTGLLAITLPVRTPEVGGVAVGDGPAVDVGGGAGVSVGVVVNGKDTVGVDDSPGVAVESANHV